MRFTQKYLCFALLAFGLLFSSFARADQEPVTREKMQNAYMTFLKQEGFVPELTEKGSVIFKSEGNVLILLASEKFPLYFRLSNIFKWTMTEEEKKQKTLTAANKASMETRVVKVVVGDDFISFDFEALMTDPESFRLFFKDALLGIRYARGVFFEAVK